MAQDAQARLISGSAINMVDVPAGANTDAEQGDVKIIGDMVVVALRGASSGSQASYARKGVYDVVKKNGQINAGAQVYWKADEDPQGGTAATGAATTNTSGAKLLGIATQLAATDAETVRVVLQGETGAGT